MYNAGAFAPSTITSVLVPVKSIISKRVLTAPSLSLDINVIVALSDGLLANAGWIVIFTSLLAESEYDETVVSTLYTLSIPEIVNTSPACGNVSNASATKVVPVWLAPSISGVP